MNVDRRKLVKYATALLLTSSLMLSNPSFAAALSEEGVPWRAPASVIPLKEEKIFDSAGTRLSGTLYLPPERKNLATIVVVHAAGSPLRSSPLYAHLIEMLPAIGMAVFVYDRRGSGESEGDRSTASFEDLADDGIAAIEMLQQDERLDPERIGVWGLSQGGWLSMLAATRSSNVAFSIAISAPMVAPDVQMLFRSTNVLRVFGHSQAEIDQMAATRTAVDNYMRGVGDRASAQRAVDAAKTQPWFRYLYMGETVSDRETSGWRREIEHDPLKTLEAVKAPLLVIYGATDPVVPVETSVERLDGVASQHPAMDVVVIAKADHDMEIGVDPRTQLDPELIDESRPDSAEYFAVLSNWLTGQGLTSRD